MIRFIDRRLDRITMYRLILYYLLGLLGLGMVFSAVGVLPYSPLSLLLTSVLLVTGCWIINRIFAAVFRVPTNIESAYISALILALIVPPIKTLHDVGFIFWVAVWAMASKYILNIRGKHIFNPVAFAVALTALTINQTASWWVGDVPMLAFVAIGGMLIIRKTRRSIMVVSFLTATILTVIGFSALTGANIVDALSKTVLYSPLVFFAAVILTEPLTTPPTEKLQVIYGIITGFLFAPQFHIAGFYTTPEIAMLIANIYSYIVSPKGKMILRLKQKIQVGTDIYDFIFTPQRQLSFAPGQYMEWTLGHTHPDSRGNRRYFTLASSPTEKELRLGVKFYPNSSSYKRFMLDMQPNSEIMAAQLSGDFTLPEDRNQRLVFIAGGIGITPFRSMVKYLIDSRQKRPITIFYANRTADEIVYKDVFDQAQRQLGIKTIYTLTDQSRVPANWTGKVGYITDQMIKNEVPYYKNCIYYLSGPNSMVNGFTDVLTSIHVPREHIKTDFFPGLV